GITEKALYRSSEVLFMNCGLRNLRLYAVRCDAFMSSNGVFANKIIESLAVLSSKSDSKRSATRSDHPFGFGMSVRVSDRRPISIANSSMSYPLTRSRKYFFRADGSAIVEESKLVSNRIAETRNAACPHAGSNTLRASVSISVIHG